MHGVVTLLPEPFYQQVESIWDMFAHELGVRGVLMTPYPHFSYHVAEHYDLDLITPILQKFASEMPPLELQTSGLGVFTGSLNPVIYVNIIRSPQLSAVHAALWPMLESCSAGIVEYYHPEQWVPHITLASGDIGKQDLPVVMALLMQQNFNWHFPINDLTLLYADKTAQSDEIKIQFPVQGK